MGKTKKAVHSDLKTLNFFGLKISGWPLAVLCATGIALLGFAGNAALEYGKQANSEKLDQIKSANEALKQYYALDDVPRLAGVYIETGKEGTPSDVRKVARFFRTILTDHSNGRYTSQQVRDNFGGRLQFWAPRFRLLSSGSSPMSGKFSESERLIFGLIAEDLTKIASSKSEVVEADASSDAAAAAHASPEEMKQLEEAAKSQEASER